MHVGRVVGGDAVRDRDCKRTRDRFRMTVKLHVDCQESDDRCLGIGGSKTTEANLFPQCVGDLHDHQFRSVEHECAGLRLGTQRSRTPDPWIVIGAQKPSRHDARVEDALDHRVLRSSRMLAVTSIQRPLTSRAIFS
jgi:hypothetical protein